MSVMRAVRATSKYYTILVFSIQVAKEQVKIASPTATAAAAAAHKQFIDNRRSI